MHGNSFKAKETIVNLDAYVDTLHKLKAILKGVCPNLKMSKVL